MRNNDLNFYFVNKDYVEYLRSEEETARGFTRVPDLQYGYPYKQKFLCGVVVEVNGLNYYVPVTSYKQKKPDNFLIFSKSGNVVSSLRFNYMIPVPPGSISIREIKNEPDIKYRALLAQELRYCIIHQEQIKRIAVRTYKKVVLGLDKWLVVNSCDFSLLEKKCIEWQNNHQNI